VYSRRELFSKFVIFSLFPAGIIYVFGVMLLNKWKVDDVVLGIPIHFFCGTWSLIVTGFLSSPSAMQEAFGTDDYAGWFYELGRGRFDATLLSNQLIAVIGTCNIGTIHVVLFFVTIFLLAHIHLCPVLRHHCVDKRTYDSLLSLARQDELVESKCAV